MCSVQREVYYIIYIFYQTIPSTMMPCVHISIFIKRPKSTLTVVGRFFFYFYFSIFFCIYLFLFSFFVYSLFSLLDIFLFKWWTTNWLKRCTYTYSYIFIYASRETFLCVGFDFGLERIPNLFIHFVIPQSLNAITTLYLYIR